MKKETNCQEEIYKLIRKDINDDVKNGRKRSHNDYMSKCEAYLNDLCCGRKPGLRRLGNWRRRDEAKQQWTEIKSYFEGVIDVLIQNAKASQVIRQINTVSAQSLISNAMKEAGLEFQYEAQQYRAKVSVKLTPNNKLVFYINYKKAAELLPGAIESARQAKELLAKLGNNASFKKCNGWEQWD